MILFPKDQPVIEHLNSYYVDLTRMFEHYQGEMPAGVIHMVAPNRVGVIFFDENGPISGSIETKGETVSGPDTVERLLSAGSDVNFTITVYEIAPEKVFLWANAYRAKPLYTNLSAEFTDLDALLKKMRSEHLTGFIEVRPPGTRDTAIILLESGRVQDVTGNWADLTDPDPVERLNRIMMQTRESGGVFNVLEIDLAGGAEESGPPPTETAPRPTVTQQAAVDAGLRDLTPVSQYLSIFEETVRGDKRIKEPFTTIFRKKCVASADRYDFLDPFAGEFVYSDKTVTFYGSADDETVFAAILQLGREMAAELGIGDDLSKALRPWARKWRDQLAQFDIGEPA